MSQIRLIDIAKKLGISAGTVSKALNDSYEISEATKKKVLKIARKMNYAPNQLAVNLRTQRTKTIGVIIPTTVHHFFSKVIDGIIEKAEKEGYLVILLQSNEKYNLERQQVDLLLKNRVDGILISLSNETDNFSHLKKIQKRKIPLVLYDKVETSIRCSKVKIDDFLAAYNCVNHLIESGYKRIAHFRGGIKPQTSIDRFEGYKKALLDHQIKFDPSLVYICDNNSDFEDGYSMAMKMISEHKDIDAVFAITDLVAIGVMKYLTDKKIKIPKEIAVFGFSNWLMSTVVSPSLSTVDQPSYKMGIRSVELLLDEIANKKQNKPIVHQEIVLPTQLILRESS